MKTSPRNSTVHLAKQVMSGEFADASARLTLQIFRELEKANTPLTRRACEKIRRDFYAHRN